MSGGKGGAVNPKERKKKKKKEMQLEKIFRSSDLDELGPGG